MSFLQNHHWIIERYGFLIQLTSYLSGFPRGIFLWVLQHKQRLLEVFLLSLAQLND